MIVFIACSLSASQKRKVSFKATDEAGNIRMLDFRKNGRNGSVFLDQDEVDGLTESTNTIQRNKLPSHNQRNKKARGSNFGIAGNQPPSRKTALQRKSSTYNENPCGESIPLTDSQRAMIEDRKNGVYALIKSGIEAMEGAVSYNQESKSLHLMLKRAECRDEALRMLKEQLGPLTVDESGKACVEGHIIFSKIEQVESFAF